MSHVERYWARPAAEVLAALDSRVDGLTASSATQRLKQFGHNALTGPAARPWLSLLLSRFSSPLVIILVVAALVSLLVREWVEAWIVLGIVLLTAVLSFIQEYRASVAIEALRRRVTVTANVIRDGALQAIRAEQVVPGDIIELSAGALVPVDALVLDARSCYVNQAMLTGETLPVEKRPGTCAVESGLAARDNCVFMGTSVRSGWARVVAVDTGRATVFGAIARRLVLRPPETEFERGLRRFGGLLIRLMLIVVVAVLAIHIVMHRPTIDTLLFAAALAVGLSPELLPAILTITLSYGARAMAREGVIVKRLNAIENLGSMDVLCTDKTGTLTRGVIELDAAVDADGQPAAEVLRLAVLNARLQTGIRNALDDAVVARGERDGLPRDAGSKIDEIPYDFQRRRLTVIVNTPSPVQAMLVTKGAVENVFDACASARIDRREVALDEGVRTALMKRFVDWSAQGYRVLAVASKSVPVRERYDPGDEAGMTLIGFLLFFDPPEPQVCGTLTALGILGVEVKIVTGDNRFVARHVAEAIGMPVKGILTGGDLRELGDEALWHRAMSTTLFAEIEPNQKERIITALQKTGHVVGYLGDGINDAPALHAADVGISVDSAVDVAKDAADFVLLEHDLDVIRRGIDEGRHTFANTIKYIFITTSANFGNMVSMALASLYLPFLPLLAKQILLNNLLSDIPAMGIAGDNVDREWKLTPHRWDIRLIRRSMLTFGLISTAFDLVTFVVLLTMAGGDPVIFRTGWFLESLLTELWILLVIRTYRPFYRSRPGGFLRWSTAAMMPLAIALPFLPGAGLFGFVPLPAPVLAAILGITALYVVVSEASKRMFYRPRLRS
ncbi:magnesium-translocating P-type ATPase [Luteibacter yeojuensis]|uniref:Magnesium-transporting ATPase, P-type 1 n=1 Tax=Luteibacter yeojuensis TaxID=345309 RepID=A0A7X5QRY8_9GAMM|nr:magnesium-translocating P-type ATPase [Luteibacter yeojuensis]NID14323.1 magnesium-translocating P-type ATPase [Luteibacter yeojuensis]